MSERLFTFVSEFRGTTYVSQVSAANELKAIQVWADLLEQERPFARASGYLAKSARGGTIGWEPVAISNLHKVWCIAKSCGGDLMIADIVETVRD